MLPHDPAELFEPPRGQIVRVWEYTEKTYRWIHPVAWEQFGLRHSAAVLYMVLVRRYLKEHLPAILSAVGERWWPPEIPNRPEEHRRNWGLEEHAARLRERIANLKDSTQGRLDDVVHWAHLGVNIYVEDELTASKGRIPRGAPRPDFPL